MLDRSTTDGAPEGAAPDAPRDVPREVPGDDEATAPLLAVRAVVAHLDVACRGASASWPDLVTALRLRAAELARGDRAAWRRAAGSAVPLAEWTAGSWAAALRAALLRDGFTRPASDRAVEVVAVALLRTCPGDHGPAGEGAPQEPLGDYPVLARLRRHLSAGTGDDDTRDDDLLSRVEALRRADRP